MGARVAGISCITNPAAGVVDQPLQHDEVMDTAARVRGQFIALLDAFITRMVAAR
jgi:purine-nucleoside phosphorylase